MGWNCRKEAWKKIRLRRDSNPVSLNTSWTPLPTDRRNHTLGGREGGLRYSPDYGGPAVININYSMSLYFKPTSQRQMRTNGKEHFLLKKKLTGIVETKYFLTRKSKGIRYGKWRKITKRERLCNSHLSLKKMHSRKSCKNTFEVKWLMIDAGDISSFPQFKAI